MSLIIGGQGGGAKQMFSIKCMTNIYGEDTERDRLTRLNLLKVVYQWTEPILK
jgi:hypothetical protein